MEELALLLGDNKSVILNTTIPSSVLKKKNCAAFYHQICEVMAVGIVRFSYIDSVDNYSDILTNPLYTSAFYTLVKHLLFRDPPKEEGYT